MSVGVTLTRARNVVFNDLSWTHADNQQARARIHRIGQKNICIAHYIIGSETDAYIKRAVEAKAKTSQKVLGHE
jgi:SWI/SNF-related matrix-associated actin-dependent regulator 1 of chromatin subfamily A